MKRGYIESKDKKEWNTKEVKGRHGNLEMANPWMQSDITATRLAEPTMFYSLLLVPLIYK